MGTARNLITTAAFAAALGLVPAMAQPPVERLIAGPTVITAAGAYAVRTSFSFNAAQGAGVVIAADGVTLDLGGHQILGPGGKQGTGIRIEGASGVTVKNGAVADTAFGVVVTDSSNVMLTGLKIRGQGLPPVVLPPETGIMIAQSRNVVVEGNALYNVGLGIFVRGSRSWGNRITRNTITAQRNGVLGICYNPTPDDPNGPRGDLISQNHIGNYNVGVQANTTAGYNLFVGNTIAYREKAFEMLNDTNIEKDSTTIQLP